MNRGSAAAAAIAVLCLSAPLPAQEEAPPRISVTEANLLASFGSPAADEPFWVLTLQHFSTWRYGSNFFFVDLVDDPGLRPLEEAPGLYLEVAPVLSLRALGALPAGTPSPLRDVGLTVQLDAGWTPGGFPIDRVLLEGVELAWGVPGFAVFNTQLLARQEEGHEPSWQGTWVYAAPVRVGAARGVVRGFLDVWRRERPGEPASTVLLAQPQLLVDLGGVQVGVELEPSHDFPNRALGPGWSLAVSPMIRWAF